MSLHLLAKEYGQRPADIVGIRDEWAAYEFDVAVMTMGKVFEADPDAFRAGTPGRKGRRNSLVPFDGPRGSVADLASLR